MTSQFPAPPTGATRLLLLADGPVGVGVSEALEDLVASYVPAIVLAPPGSGRGERLAARVAARCDLDARLADAGSAVAAVGSVVEAWGGSCAVLVASEAVLRTLLCEALGVPLASAWRFHIDAGAVSVVEVGPDGRWALVRLNEPAGRSAGGAWAPQDR